MFDAYASMLKLAQEHPGVVLPCIGLHPAHVRPTTDGYVAELEPMLAAIKGRMRRTVQQAGRLT